MGPYYEIVICFILFSFCGWVCESVFCSILERKPVNRGFLSGPICPVYGFGGLIVVYLLGPLKGNYIALFFFGMIACTVLEYITSWLLEKLFQAKWWDYSENPFNINGRVCLSFSLVFGGLSVVAVELLYPPFIALVNFLPDTAERWIARVLLVLLISDCANTVYSLIQLNGKLADIKNAMEELRVKFDQVQDGNKLALTQRIEEFKLDYNGKYEEFRQGIQQSVSRFEGLLKNRPKFQHRRIMDAFPNMRSLKYQEQMAKLRETIDELRNKKNNK